MAPILQGEVNFHGAVERLLPHQRQFIGAEERCVAYVGGVGSGKTIALCLSAILESLNEPNGFTLIGRLNMPALENSTMKTFLELVDESWGTWAETRKKFTCSNGHVIVFSHLDINDPKVAGHIKSMNLSRAYVDEASEISDDIQRLILSRLRRKTTQFHKLRLTSNPAGHDWLWRNYFDPDRSDKLKKFNRGITATTFDNVHLSKDYVENMLASWPADWQDRYIHGHFSDFSDLIYKEFTERSHVWDAEIPHEYFQHNTMPPQNWPVIVGIDIGSDVEHDPWSIPLIAVSPEGLLFQFDEIYGRGLLIANIADEYWAKLGSRPTPDIAYDYSNRQCALELAEHNIHGQPAIKEVLPGLQKVGQYMHVDPRLTHPFLGTAGAPRYYVASHCRNTIREITAYKYAKDRAGNSTNEPAHENSHSPDAIRYAIHTYRPLPEKIPVPKVWQNPKLDEMSRLYWKDVAKQEEKATEEPTAPKWQRPRGLKFQRPGYARTRLSR